MAVLILALSACGPGVSVAPGLHCSGASVAEAVPGAALLEEWTATARELAHRCGPMLTVTIKSYIGERHGQEARR